MTIEWNQLTKKNYLTKPLKNNNNKGYEIVQYWYFLLELNCILANTANIQPATVNLSAQACWRPHICLTGNSLIFTHIGFHSAFHLLLEWPSYNLLPYLLPLSGVCWNGIYFTGVWSTDASKSRRVWGLQYPRRLQVSLAEALRIFPQVLQCTVWSVLKSSSLRLPWQFAHSAVTYWLWSGADSDQLKPHDLHGIHSVNITMKGESFLMS